jgi:DNA-binding transcriptional LysR family regulator
MQNRRITDRALRSAGIDPAPRIEADSLSALLAFAQAGWSTVVGHTWLTGRTLAPGMHVHPLRRPEVHSTVGLITAAGAPLTPVARVLRDELAGRDLQAILDGPATI